jgi:hypothetical protein
MVCRVWAVVGGDELGLLGMERLLTVLRPRKGQIGGCWCGDWKREVGSTRVSKRDEGLAWLCRGGETAAGRRR